MSANDLDGLRSAIETLKQYKRSNLKDGATAVDLTKALYVDPRPNDATLLQLKRPSHALVLGRKGTGKSTLFQRFQVSVRETGTSVSAYLDIKALFQHAQLKSVQEAVGSGQNQANAQFALELCLWRSFMALLITDIIAELPKQEVRLGFWQRLAAQLGLVRTRNDMRGHFTGLRDIQRYVDRIQIDRFLRTEGETRKGEVEFEEGGIQFAVNVSQEPGVSGGVQRVASQTTALQSLLKNKGVALQQLRIDKFIDDLRGALAASGLQYLHLVVDDFSELPEEAMQLFAACILEPFDNLASDIVKFKIAAYPGRVVLGNVDRGRFEVIHLDSHELFKATDVATRDARAIEFVKRLVSNRITHFCRCDPTEFFEEPEDRIWESLYFASAANPRTLGHILYFMLEHYLERGKRITINAVGKGAEAHYHERIDTVFSGGRSADQTLAPRGTLHTHQDLLERLITRAQSLANRERGAGEPANLSSIRVVSGGKIPVSHFRTASQLEDFLASLELNAFVSKYADVTDAVGTKFTVYTFNYGMCQVYKLPWYGTKAAEKHGRFFMTEELDFSQAVVGYYNEAIEFVCSSCKRVEPGSFIEVLKRIQMWCPHCREGTMAERPTRLNYGPAPALPKPELVLSEKEFELVALLGDSKKALSARQMGPELDMTASEVGHRASALVARGIVESAGKVGGKNTYKLSVNAQASYDKIKKRQTELLELEPA